MLEFFRKKVAEQNLPYAAPQQVFDAIDDKTIDEKTADFVFNECQKRLEATISSIRYLKNKVTLILGFLFTVISFQLGQLISLLPIDKKDGSCIDNYNSYIIIFLSIHIVLQGFIVLYLVFQGFKPTVISTIGSYPSELLDNASVVIKGDVELKIWHAQHYENSIYDNDKIINKISTVIIRSLAFIFIAFILATIISLIGSWGLS